MSLGAAARAVPLPFAQVGVTLSDAEQQEMQQALAALIPDVGVGSDEALVSQIVTNLSSGRPARTRVSFGCGGPWGPLVDRVVRVASLMADGTRQSHPVLFWLDIARISCYRITMILSFRTAGTEDIFNGRDTRAARRTCPSSLWRVATRKLDQIDSATALRDLMCPPGNKLEALSGDRKGQHSIRINDQYRVCLVWTDRGPALVEIVDYH